uniref:Uncharacterized protein n=1 Tax=Rhizophora mucronata TaxID=61149 RepID=A0A2P2QJ36_RHIMU
MLIVGKLFIYLAGEGFCLPFGYI